MDEPNYIQAISKKYKEKRVLVGGQVVTIKRPTLKRFADILALNQNDDFYSIIEESTNLTEEYLDGMHPAYVLKIWDWVRKSLEFYFMLPFMIYKESKLDPWDYENRWLAKLVHEIASTYHWTRDYIFSLYPEEVFCYIQEILLDKYNNQEWDYIVSSVGYDKQGHKKPFPELNWPKKITFNPKVEVSLKGMGLAVSTRTKQKQAIVGTMIEYDPQLKEIVIKNIKEYNNSEVKE